MEEKSVIHRKYMTYPLWERKMRCAKTFEGL